MHVCGFFFGEGFGELGVGSGLKHFLLGLAATKHVTALGDVLSRLKLRKKLLINSLEIFENTNYIFFLVLEDF